MSKFNKISIIVSVIMLFLAISPLPYGYYTLLRLIICGTAIYTTYNAKKINRQGWIWIVGIIALLFNPLLPIYLNKELWIVIDIIVACIFLIYLFQSEKWRINMRLFKRILIGIGAVIVLIAIVWVGIYFYYQTRVYPIDLVKRKYSYNNFPTDLIKDIKGDITIYEWEIKRAMDKPNTYLVSYTYATVEDKTKGIRQGWWWEVNTKVGIVRNVTEDVELQKRYGLQEISEVKETKPVEKTVIAPEKNEEEKKEIERKKQEVEQAKAKWRRLEKGMTQNQVRNILGEPEKVIAPLSFSIDWYYSNYGKVEFWEHYQDKVYKLNSWTEPNWNNLK